MDYLIGATRTVTGVDTNLRGSANDGLFPLACYHPPTGKVVVAYLRDTEGDFDLDRLAFALVDPGTGAVTVTELAAYSDDPDPVTISGVPLYFHVGNSLEFDGTNVVLASHCSNESSQSYVRFTTFDPVTLGITDSIVQHTPIYASAGNQAISVAFNPSGGFVIVYWKSGYTHGAVAGSVSGGVISLGAAITLSASSSARALIVKYVPAFGKFVAWTGHATSQERVTLLSVTGNTVSEQSTNAPHEYESGVGSRDLVPTATGVKAVFTRNTAVFATNLIVTEFGDIEPGIEETLFTGASTTLKTKVAALATDKILVGLA